MKKGLLTLALIIACKSLVSAEASQPPPQEPPAWAEKMFGPPANRVHDFGAVVHGVQLHYGFVMTNIYAVPIKITSVRSS